MGLQSYFHRSECVYEHLGQLLDFLAHKVDTMVTPITAPEMSGL